MISYKQNKRKELINYLRKNEHFYDSKLSSFKVKQKFVYLHLLAMYEVI